MSVDIKKRLAFLLETIFDMPEQELIPLIETPPRPEFGDFALPCFSFAKKLKKDPRIIAETLAEDFEKQPKSTDLIKRTKAEGAYLNLFINKARVVKEIIRFFTATSFEEIREMGRERTVVIDFSSPNIAKPFGIGHLRSTVIGNALKKIFLFLGYEVVGINHLGDWGTQFGKLITAFQKWGNRRELESDPINYLYRLYVRFHSEAEKSPELEDEARAWFGKLERGDSDAKALWEDFRDLSIGEYKKIYERLGVDFDYYAGESFYDSMLDATVEKLEKSGITEESEGALIVPLEDMPPALIKKSDGSTLYLTRDIAAALYRHEAFGFDMALYVVGSPQALHFKQLFMVLEKMGYGWSQNCHHIPFGHIRFEEGAMSTRKGNVIFLEEVINRAVDLASDIIQEKNPGLKQRGEIAEAVGIGAIIFNDLKNSRIKDITFDWDEILNFNGETGVYLQYTHARINSLLKKFCKKYGKLSFDEDVAFSEEGYAIAVLLNRFEDAVARAAQEFEPTIISRYLLELASQFNTYYNTHRVITKDRALSFSRALLVCCVKKVLEQGLELLGIRAVEEM